jgi:hypothetical protein
VGNRGQAGSKEIMGKVEEGECLPRMTEMKHLRLKKRGRVYREQNG